MVKKIDILPSYERVLAAKKRCYPKNITVSESCAAGIELVLAFKMSDFSDQNLKKYLTDF